MNLFKTLPVTLVLWLANQLVDSKITCPKNQYIVVKNGTESCLPCNSCPHGFGLSPPCGSKVDHPPPIDCVPCVPGKTYSDKYGPSACKNCHICSAKEIVTRNCTASDNSICSNTCEEGYYYENSTHNCQPCSNCCNKDNDKTIKECKSMPPSKQCSIHSAQHCKPKPTIGVATPLYHTTTGTLSTSASKILDTGVIVAWVIAGVAVGVILIIALILLYKRRKKIQRRNIIGRAAHSQREDHDAEHHLLNHYDDQCYLNQLELHSITNDTLDPLSEGGKISLTMNCAIQNGNNNNNNRKCNFDFEWKKDGHSIPNNHYQKYSKENVDVADSGQYYCEIHCNKHPFAHKEHSDIVKIRVRPREGTELKLFTDLDWNTLTKIENWLKPNIVGTGNWMNLGIEFGIDEDALEALDKEKAPNHVLQSIKCSHPDLTVFDFWEKMKSDTMKQNKIAKFLQDHLTKPTKPKEPQKSGTDVNTRPDSGIDEEFDSDVPLRVNLPPEPSKPSQLKIPALVNLGHADSSREASRESSLEDLRSSDLNNVQDSNVPLRVNLQPEPSKPSQLKIPALVNLGHADSSREASRESSLEDLSSVLNNAGNSMKPVEDKGFQGLKRILRRKRSSGGSQNISDKSNDFEDDKDEDEKSNTRKTTLYGRQTSKDSQKSDDVEVSGTRERRRSRSSSIASSIKEIVLKQSSVEYSALDHHHEESDEGGLEYC